MYVSLLFAVTNGSCRLWCPPAFYDPSCGGATLRTCFAHEDPLALTHGRDIQAVSDRNAVVAFAPSPFLKLKLRPAPIPVAFGLHGQAHRKQFLLRPLRKRHITRLSTFASKTPAVAGVLLIGLHYTVDFAASAASLEIFGGGWAGNVSPSRSSRIARSGFGST